jgi:hypothetical protein
MIDQMRADIAYGNTVRGQLKDYIVGGIIGAVLGAILTGLLTML